MRKRQGFTLVEVMISLGVMTVGALALFGMQQQTTRANVHARTLTVASQIAQNVIERLKMDSLGWTSVSGLPATDLARSPLIGRITAGGAFGQFVTLPAVAGLRPLSNAFDFYGADVDITGGTPAELARVYYCASYRLSWVYTTNTAMRADVRVWWSKEAPTRDITTDFPLCADNNVSLNPGGGQYDNYHVVYLSTVLRPMSTL